MRLDGPVPLLTGDLGLVLAFVAYRRLRAIPTGGAALTHTADQIRAGALRFLQREFVVLAPFALVVAAAAWFALGGRSALAFAVGAWDNANKYIESRHFGSKGAPAHHASIVGDTVGDPFKDLSDPSRHILIKLMAIVALAIAPLL